ncbi:kinase-like domain-containing protein [Schizophyllum amplum]|uniref:non-specific serine/threonine protein kinase n=1 Tax=Schizophyllum amplum TaxID=97359 RepID=A0A550C4Y1_9AGAR|nr:kinase-like domain-containing protein [Auriculariopsis ampla]
MRLLLEDLIDSGGYGKVYVGRVTNERPTRTVAVKKGRVARAVQLEKNPMLRHEACAMLKLRGHPNIPEVYAWGRSQIFEYLALQMLGDPIDAPLLQPEGLTMRNLIALTCQMLDALEHVHSHHIIHCDVKPNNFLFEVSPTSGLIKLIDFGIARVYRNLDTQQHIQESTLPRHIGTRNYISIHVHLHHNPSRRDDMESLAYTIADLLRDGLPWDRREVESRDVLSVKQAWSGSALCAGYPAVFGAFIDYARSLGFRDAPDYANWRRRFLAVAHIPDTHGPVLYDPLDRGTAVGKCPEQEEPSVIRPAPHLSSQDSDSEDLTFPCAMSTWADPSTVADENRIGDERKTVHEQLEWIEDLRQASTLTGVKSWSVIRQHVLYLLLCNCIQHVSVLLIGDYLGIVAWWLITSRGF